MWATLKRISLGLILILAASGILLLSDRHRRKSSVSSKPLKRVYKIGVVYFAPDLNVDVCLHALRTGLKDRGLVEGNNLDLQTSHAQAEIVNIPALLQNYDSQDLDLIMTLTTPCLTAACATIKDKPVVFTLTYDPIAAGAGTSFNEHLANMTGIGSFPPLVETIDLMSQAFPGLHTVGIVYNNSEANSRKVIDVARGEFQKRGMKLEEVTVTSTTDVFQAALSLTQRQVEVLWAAGDNTVRQSFESLIKVAEGARVPLISNDMGIGKGQLIEVGLSAYDSCYAAVDPLVRILNGANPAQIPIRNVAVMKMTIDLRTAKQLRYEIPPAILDKAFQVVEDGGKLRALANQ